MKVGTVCYSHSRGLGHLARDFIAHGLVTDICVVRHPGIPMQPWYPSAPVVDLRRLDRATLYGFAEKMDVMLFFETAFDPSLIPFCRSKGIPTFIVPMMECWQTAWPHPHKFICPSLLDLQVFPRATGGESIFLPVPTEYPWRLRTRAEHWIHNGGYLGVRGREGTALLIEAMQHVKSPLRLTIRVQENVDAAHKRMMAADPRIEYIAGTVPYEDLYATGDVAVSPQRWNGMSLPLQEACAAGLAVMTTDRFPANTWLPKEPLIPVARTTRSRIGPGYLEFEEAVIRPEDIAATMDRWYGADIEALSLAGKAWAEAHSWEVLGPRWKEALAS